MVKKNPLCLLEHHCKFMIAKLKWPSYMSLLCLVSLFQKITSHLLFSPQAPTIPPHFSLWDDGLVQITLKKINNRELPCNSQTTSTQLPSLHIVCFLVFTMEELLLSRARPCTYILDTISSHLLKDITPVISLSFQHFQFFLFNWIVATSIQTRCHFSYLNK